MSKNTLKIGNKLQAGGSVSAKFSSERDLSHQSFLHRQIGQWMPYNFVANSFHKETL